MAETRKHNQNSQSINWFDRKINYAKKEKDHEDEINELVESRTNLENRVFDLKIPVVFTIECFKEMMKDAEEIEQRMNKHVDNCYAIANLRKEVQFIKEKIHHLKEDNKIVLGWTPTTMVLSTASIGVAFIPIVGLPIAAVMVAVPYLGKLFHRLAVSYKRKKQFKQKASKVKAKAQSKK